MWIVPPSTPVCHVHFGPWFATRALHPGFSLCVLGAIEFFPVVMANAPGEGRWKHVLLKSFRPALGHGRP